VRYTVAAMRLLPVFLALTLAACDDEKPSASSSRRATGDAGVVSALDADALGEAAAAALSAKPTRTRPEKEGKRRPKSVLLTEARELIGWRVADGFLPRDELITLAVAAADNRETLRAELVSVVDEELAAHRAREQTWRHATDADRLTRAFQALEKQGVIARERFTDCRTCGVAEMKLLREELLEQGKRADGFVFYTEQDADGVSESGELMLEYGSFRDDPAATARIGQRVHEVLSSERFEPAEESDEGETYLVLSGLEWQRRRFTRAPAR
jgi:hypothetical protein